jgi:IclR family transcriptional regulator, acetate operon repressor
MAALGAPIFDYRGRLRAAISFSGPKPGVLGDAAAANTEAILLAARDISRGLGFEATEPTAA